MGEQMRSDMRAIWDRILVEDQFSDQEQNESKPDEIKNVQKVLDTLRSLEARDRPFLNVGCGSGSQMDFDYFLDPSEFRSRNLDKKVIEGYIEKMPFDDGSLGCIECWGTWGFLRSQVDAMLEVSRCLKIGGAFIFDVFTYSTMPIAQTVNGTSFMNWVALFGFNVQGYIRFGDSWHCRLGLRLEKISDFDPNQFRMPQVIGRVNNYVEGRDWYMI
jgi:SAM-dependent methyltransferase